jgi:hypothetical protein
MEAVVEIDENERYWVGGGFGHRGLLPTGDRGVYTTTDGSICWKSIEEASEDLILLGRGWTYEAGTEFAPTTGQWMYAKDFRIESIKNAKPERTMTSFVRFRRLHRIKKFNPDEFVPRHVSEKCTQVDSTATQALSNFMVDVLTYCTLLYHPHGPLPAAVALPLKERVINVSISQEYPPANSAPDVFDASFQLHLLREKLEAFVDEERAKTIMNRLLTSIEFTFDQRMGKKEFIDRKNELTTFFPQTERDAIASLIIKKLDTQFQLHCDQPNCGERCLFYRLPCNNEGCKEVMSRVYLKKHDKECPYKVVTCECGDNFPRHQTPIHRSQACKMRPVDCPFKNLGCIKIVKACELQAHVIDDAPAHLLLAVNRMAEHQDIIKQLHGQMQVLEKENKELKSTIEEKENESKEEFSKLGNRVTKIDKELSTLEKTFKREFARRGSLKDSQQDP